MTKKTTKLTIAHINDTHSYFDPSSVYLQLPIEHKDPVHAYVSCGGFSRIASRVKQLKAESVRIREQAQESVAWLPKKS